MKRTTQKECKRKTKTTRNTTLAKRKKVEKMDENTSENEFSSSSSDHDSGSSSWDDIYILGELSSDSSSEDEIKEVVIPKKPIEFVDLLNSSSSDEDNYWKSIPVKDEKTSQKNQKSRKKG